jgi:hypothetical protein
VRIPRGPNVLLPSFLIEPLTYATGKIGVVVNICTLIRKMFVLNFGWAIIYPERSYL